MKNKNITRLKVVEVLLFIFFIAATSIIWTLVNKEFLTLTTGHLFSLLAFAIMAIPVVFIHDGYNYYKLISDSIIVSHEPRIFKEAKSNIYFALEVNEDGRFFKRVLCDAEIKSLQESKQTI